MTPEEMDALEDEIAESIDGGRTAFDELLELGMNPVACHLEADGRYILWRWHKDGSRTYICHIPHNYASMV